MLSIKNLQVAYNNISIIENLNVNIEEGEIIGILGKNGAGKTTFFNALYHNIPYKGSIHFENKAISRKQIGFLETENYFYPYMTGEEYLSFFTHKKSSDFCRNLIKKFDLPLKKFVQNYSTGMKKKLALLALLLLDKPVIILDEPFNGMDFEGVGLLYEVIQDLKKEKKIVLISSHIIETLFNTCDKIAILQNKQITEVIEHNNFSLLKDIYS
ncbi:MAG: ABC transporter ATP-binding protein [Chryseobacterium sp.]|jgi:ABC-2 type transport system ATP-binding protein|uniref:ABC transporter ATP-binding protein n=1 Tax=Chryseobacterium sp. TaxID=1871047 RepID=UPI00281C8171|nr:ABC transporter ATP-binding protein [Chryseobacterium sp.]MDR2237840.1 ABC transporter ATP-binding protein [Chryseobacterium sp.]